MRQRVATVLRIAIQLVIALAPGGLILVGLYQLYRRRKGLPDCRSDNAP